MVRSVRLAAALATLLAAVVIPAGAARATSATCTVTAADAAIDAQEQQLLNLINAYRASNGIAPLRISQVGTRAATWFSHDMATDNYFPPDHVDSNGRDIPSRLTWCGATFDAWAENIAANTAGSDPQVIFDQWKNSPPHNTNLLSQTVTRIGIGRAFNAASDFDWYWTVDFLTETSQTSVAGLSRYDDGTSGRTGPGGTAIRVLATKGLPNEGYQLVIATPAAGPIYCDNVIAVLNPALRKANNSGLISQTAATIPALSPGVYHVCFKSTADRSPASVTSPLTFTVV